MVSRFENYDEFLQSLDMQAEIKPFTSLYLERITQLVNKTNQFNLTTKRYSYIQIESISNNSQYIALYGRLTDKFGDNGLVSVIIGNICGDEVQVDLWLMSCRVIKRGMEHAMFDQFVRECIRREKKIIRGVYLKSSKNNMVSDLYRDFGFEQERVNINGDTFWACNFLDAYEKKNKWIEVLA